MAALKMTSLTPFLISSETTSCSTRGHHHNRQQQQQQQLIQSYSFTFSRLLLCLPFRLHLFDLSALLSRLW